MGYAEKWPPVHKTLSNGRSIWWKLIVAPGKVDVPNSVTSSWSDTYIRAVDVHWCDWITCSKCDNHSRFNGQLNSRAFIWPFNEHKKHHFNNESDNHMNSKNYEESDYYSLDLDILTIELSSNVHIRWVVGWSEKVSIQDPSALQDHSALPTLEGYHGPGYPKWVCAWGLGRPFVWP